MVEPWLLVAPDDRQEGEKVVLDREESRHLAGALRARVGDFVVLADGCGMVARAQIRLVDSRRSEAEVVSVSATPRPAGDGVTVALGILHGRAMDWAVQKAVEVGVRRFSPLRTHRGQLSRKAIGGRLDHWRRVARQALKQCHRPWEMEVAEPVELEELVQQRGDHGGLVADREGVPIGELGDEIPRLLLVGPEGGLSRSEAEFLSADLWPRVRLGPYVLRAETAAIVGAAALVTRQFTS
jgi:16S rRNA (uracil1498-N3)-methyltransferase